MIFVNKSDQKLVQTHKSDTDDLHQPVDSSAVAGWDTPGHIRAFRQHVRNLITEKSDATNEFITYAVGPVAEVINDTLTAYIVGENDYCTKNEKVMVWLARFKHVDVVDSATNLDKLRGIGFNYDELREMVGYPVLNTEFSQARALTKNYGEEGNGNAT